MTKPANRLLTLILLLQRQPNQKAADLADSLGVSVRTLHRYIELLDEMGIPVYTERGPCGGFSLVRGYKMPPLSSPRRKPPQSPSAPAWSKRCGGICTGKPPMRPWPNWKTSCRNSTARR